MTQPEQFAVIRRLLCEHFNITESELLAKRRTFFLVQARWIGMWLSGKLTLASTSIIAREFNRGDHATAIWGMKSAEEMRETDPRFLRDSDELFDKAFKILG